MFLFKVCSCSLKLVEFIGYRAELFDLLLFDLLFLIYFRNIYICKYRYICTCVYVYVCL